MSFAAVEMLQAALWRGIAMVLADHAGIFASTTVAATPILSLMLWRGVERPSQNLLHLAARSSRD
ncbi:MAG: hypothetical protein EXR01_09215 [Acetobacteraceae bacterium]|nr:hypothetical protein [Acetobacteraceae bacterium]